MLGSSKKLKDLALSLPFVPSSDAHIEYGGALLLCSQLKRIKTRIWGWVSGLLLGQKPKSSDADLILSLSDTPQLLQPSACPISTTSLWMGTGTMTKVGRYFSSSIIFPQVKT